MRKISPSPCATLSLRQHFVTAVSSNNTRACVKNSVQKKKNRNKKTDNMQEYEEPTQNITISTSVSMYGRIRSWLLHGHDELPPELIRGNLVNQKVNTYLFFFFKSS